MACRSLTSEHEKLPSQHGNLLVQDSSFFKPRMPKGVSFRNTCTFYGGVCVCVVGGGGGLSNIVKIKSLNTKTLIRFEHGTFDLEIKIKITI